MYKDIEWKKNEVHDFEFHGPKWSIFVEKSYDNNKWYWELVVEYGRGTLSISNDYYYKSSKYAKRAAKYFLEEWNFTTDGLVYFK